MFTRPSVLLVVSGWQDVNIGDIEHTPGFVTKSVKEPELLNAFKDADVMLHGSGPSLVGADNLACWDKLTGKPFGIFGVTLQNPGDYHVQLLRKASGF